MGDRSDEDQAKPKTIADMTPEDWADAEAERDRFDAERGAR